METLQKLRKEFKAYGKIELMFDVYGDRVNFVGYSNDFIVEFFRRRDVLCWPDRSGYSIDFKSAQALGIPVEIGTYLVPCKDLRKREIKKYE